jgi:hypothetical protein
MITLVPAVVNVVVPRPSDPTKNELSVDVDIKLPTVSCDVVAMSVVPRELETMMELAGKDVEFVPPLATGRVPVIVESERHVPEIA